MKNDKQILRFNPKEWYWYAYIDTSAPVKEKYHDAACVLAEGWTTCACGQLCDVLPKRSGEVPNGEIS